MQKLKDLYQTDQGVHCQFSSLANVVNYYNPNIKSSNHQISFLMVAILKHITVLKKDSVYQIFD